jgi:(2Fe-2S) ferredoxin
MSCCLDQCLANVGVTVSPAGLIWYSRAAPALPVFASNFSSRGDSPQVRPPIL